MKNKRIAICVFMLLAALTMGIGYAAFTDTLTIIGNAHIDMAQAEANYDAKIYFSDAKAKSSTGTGSTDDVVSYSGDDATFTANKLATLGESSVFTFTITNDSNVDVIISVADKKLSGAENPSNSNAEKFDVDYEYSIQNMTVSAGGGTIDVTVTVTVKEAITTATSATFGIELTATTAE